MVEQIRISPEEVRGYGNVCEEHSLDDFIVSSSGLAKEKENVHGALTDVYKLVYSVYGLMFDFDKGNKQLYLQMAEADILSFGFDDESKQLYLVDVDDTGFNLGFDTDTNELYITDDAPPIVHNYSIALDQSSYTTTGSLSVSATLLDDGVAVEGATVSFSGGVSTVTATTNSSGVATATVNFTSSGTLTASYSNVSDTASVTVSHNYSLAFSSSSYVATDGSAEVSVTLLDDNVAVNGATISFTGGTSTVTGVTNSSGVATATVSVSATSTITATYQNVTDTCTVTVGPSYLFYDGGVTGNVNTDYTDVGSGIQIDVTSTGTKISCTSYANRYRRPNVLISGDFRVTVTCVETTDNGFEMALLNSSNTKQYHLTFPWANGKDWNNNDTQLVTNISAVTDSPVVMERVGSTLTVKCNGTQLLTTSITTSDVYYAFGTHSQGSRYCIIKDLMIEAL